MRDGKRHVKMILASANVLWTTGSSEQLDTDFPFLPSENQDDRDASAKRPGFQFNFPQDVA
jgi:hypothetical protein